VNSTSTQAVAVNQLTAVAWLRLLFVVGLAAAVALTPGFLSAPSLLTLLTTVSFVGCVAVGMTFITLSGNIMSFSLGATVAACAVTFVTVLNAAGVFAGIVAALAVGGLLSAAQGAIIGGLRANPIIVSIAALALIHGGLNFITGNATTNATPGAGHEILRGKLFGLPIEFVALLILVVLGQLILSWTTFGRHIYFVGSGARAAEAVGLRVGWVVTGGYFLAGLFSAVAGVLLGLRYNQANMEYGIGYDYDAIAAILVGGTAIQGGHGSVIRTFAGVIFIATIQVLLLLHGFRQEWQYLIAGIIVLLVVMLQTAGRRRV
jgi:ribose/xylose/arabinose/galactoside ABC-type transport system permease subunit